MSRKFLKLICLMMITLSCKKKAQEPAADSTTAETWTDGNSFKANLIIEEKSDSVILEQKDFKLPLIHELLKNGNFTSGSSNPPFGLEYESDEDYSYGCYYMYSTKIQKGSPITAKIYVRFKSEDWRSDDPSQEVMAISIEQSPFTLIGLGITMEDDLSVLKKIYPNCEWDTFGYKVYLKSSIISVFQPFSTIQRINIIRTEGLLASCSNELNTW